MLKTNSENLVAQRYSKMNTKTTGPDILDLMIFSIVH